MADPVLVGTGVSGPTTGTAVTAEALPTVLDGDVAYWQITALVGSTATLTGLPTGVTIDQGPATNASNALQVWLLKKTLAATDSGMVLTATLSASAQWMTNSSVTRGAAWSVSTVSVQNTLNATNIPYPTFTPSVDNVLAVAHSAIQFQNSAGSVLSTPPSGWTEQEDAIQTTGTTRAGTHVTSLQYGTGTAGVAQSGITAGNTINHRSVTWVILVQPTGAPPTPTPVDPTAVGMIGDSLTAQTVAGPGVTDMESRFTATGYTAADVDGIQGRFLYRGSDTSGGTPAVLAAWAGANYNPYTLVIALGTNNTLTGTSASWAGELTALRADIADKLPGTHDIVFVDVVADPVGGLDMDRVIGSQSNSVASWNSWLASQLVTGERIISWNAYAKGHPTLSDPANGASNWQNDANEVHMNNSGYTLRNAFIAAQLDPTPDGAAAIAATVTLVVSGTKGLDGGSTIASTASILAAGTVAKSTTSNLAATTALTSTGVVGKTTGASAVITAAITAAGQVGRSTGAAVTTTAAITTSGTVARSGDAAITAVAAVTASGVVVAVGNGAASLTGTATVAASGTVASAQPAAVTVVVTVVAAGTVTAAGTGAAAIVAIPTIVATGTIAGTSTTQFAATATIAAAGLVQDPSAERDITITATLPPRRWTATTPDRRWKATT